MSLAEDLCYEILKGMIKSELIRNYRPDWLKNPATGANLEIDIWCEEYKIGFEIQGPHHLFDEKQIERDNVKKETFKRLHYKFIEVGINQANTYCLYGILKSVNKTRRKPIPLEKSVALSSSRLRSKASGYTEVVERKYGITSFSPSTYRHAKDKEEISTLGMREATKGRPVKFKTGSKELFGRVEQVLSEKRVRINHGGKPIDVKWKNIISFI